MWYSFGHIFSLILPIFCSLLLVLCFSRLVSLGSRYVLFTAGANEINLIHLHAAVYALFLCLYAMFPCYCLKYLQQYFQSAQNVKGTLQCNLQQLENASG